MKKATIAVLGAGTMGQVILKGLLSAGHPKSSLRATVRTRETAAALERDLGIIVTTDNVAAARGADVVILSLKPKTLAPVARALAEAGAVGKRSLVVSIAAGVGLASLEAALGDTAAVIRAMPNTPCSVGCGTTVLSPGKKVTRAQIRIATALFEPLGRVLELPEQHMDTVTGLSASGPAFVYVILEALADGGVARGLPRKVAIEMAAQMVYGAAAMVLRSGRHPAALKDDVTTPAGCTIAGILALEDGRIRSVLSRAVEIASVRAGELGRTG
ncbi:MAG: pyrroline-5-carboxylate reductase [Holophagales bacterium]|nr:MAG: pyrroline-5-carboxylate reductase [Holophagales bacterium]